MIGATEMGRSGEGRDAMERRFETDRVEEAISKFAARIESLHQLISAVAQGSEG